MRGERRLGFAMLAPALAVLVLLAVVPMVWTVWESLHRHDLRMPWQGRPFVGLAQYVELLGDTRFGAALMHTAFFTVATVALELVLGLALALVMHRVVRGRGAVRAAALLPWAMPTVVVALLWRFVFESRTGAANAVLMSMGVIGSPIAWLADPVAAWVPLVLADVWKTTPFVALLLLAGLQSIDPLLYEAAAVDGAGPWARFRHITLPMLRHAILVAVIFRTLDAFRVFDLVYVLTSGGPGTATEPVALYTFTALLQHLRFGYGSAMSVVILAIALLLAFAAARLIGHSPERAS
ncbi:MAG TPA: sugar ABC transporter permease [Gemmatimonadaceae bacterium]|jgi:ABC-type sugar transport system permease subunit